MRNLQSLLVNRRKALYKITGLVSSPIFVSTPVFASLIQQAEAETQQDFFPAMDAHTHFYDPTRPEGVPWPSKSDPVLYRKVLPAEFKKLAMLFNIRSTIVVEASSWVEDNQWILDLAKDDKFIAGLVGRLDPASDDFLKHWKRFVKNPLFLGIRVNNNELRKGLDNKNYLDNLGAMAADDRQLDVNGGPETPADVAKLAKLLPQLRIVINHAGNLLIDGKTVPPAWLQGMQDAGKNKNVFCKVSGLTESTRKTMGDAPKDVEFYKPVLDSLWNAFGEDRLIFGSNWPVCVRASSFSTLHKIVNDYFLKKGNAPAEKYFLKNALAAYKPPLKN